MTQFLVHLLLAAQLQTTPAAATPEPVNEGLSLQQAQILPVRELAHLVLGLAGSRYREVRRPFFSRGPGSSGFNLAFATAPRSAGFPGLCRSDIIDVYFWPSENGSVPDVMRVHTVQTGSAFKIVGDTTPLGGEGWSNEYGRRLDDLCAAAGSVFAGDAPEEQQSHFFFLDQNSSQADAYFVARALQQAVENSRASRIRITCAEDPSEPAANACADPRALIANLDLGSVWGFRIERCTADPSNLCVEVGFFDPPSPQFETRRMGVSIRTNASQTDPPPHAFSVSAVHIDHSTIAH